MFQPTADDLAALVGPKKIEVIYQRPPLKPYQLDAFFHDLRYAWIEGTTKAGKTFTGIIWLHEQAITGTFKNYWWVAPTYKTAKIAYTRMLAAIPVNLRKGNETELTITLWNGHVIWFLSAEKPDNLYGEDVGAVVIDEASRMKEAAWHAIRSVVTYTRGKVRAIGNVKGRKNWFFKLCRRTQSAMASNDPKRDSHWALITAKDAVREGILTQEEIDDAKSILPEDVFNELYLGIATEDGSNPFGLKHIAKCVRADLSALSPAAFGWDIARAVDWFVGIGLDALGSVCSFTRFQKPWEDAYPAVYEVMDANRAMALCDSTGVGDPVVARMQKDRPRRYEGYKFTSNSKQRLMEGLAVAIQNGEVSFPDGPIRMELENFEYEYTRTGVRYSAPEGFHDDCVMALALAVEMLKRREKKMVKRIYPAWGDANELERLPPYHQEQWKHGKVRIASVVKPQERRPWAMAWFATFQNDDVVAFAEYPLEDFAAAKRPTLDVDAYRSVILETERAIGRTVTARRIDLEQFPWTDPSKPHPILAAFSKPCQECVEKYDRAEVIQRCRHRLGYKPVFQDATGLELVRAAIGDTSREIRPKLYAMKGACLNFCAAKRNYAYLDDDAAKDEKPDILDKDFNDLDLALFNSKINLWREAPDKIEVPTTAMRSRRPS